MSHETNIKFFASSFGQKKNCESKTSRSSNSRLTNLSLINTFEPKDSVRISLLISHGKLPFGGILGEIHTVKRHDETYSPIILDQTEVFLVSRQCWKPKKVCDQRFEISHFEPCSVFAHVRATMLSAKEHRKRRPQIPFEQFSSNRLKWPSLQQVLGSIKLLVLTFRKLLPYSLTKQRVFLNSNNSMHLTACQEVKERGCQSACQWNIGCCQLLANQDQCRPNPAHLIHKRLTLLIKLLSRSEFGLFVKPKSELKRERKLGLVQNDLFVFSGLSPI